MPPTERCAIVVQRFHPDVIGGAEQLARGYAQLLSGDYSVDVITSRALDADRWSNELTDSNTPDANVRILRFDSQPGHTPYWFRLYELLSFHHRLRMYALTAGQELTGQSRPANESRTVPADPEDRPAIFPWSIALQEEWIRTQGPYCPGMFDYLRTHARQYCFVLFVTYLFAPTYFGIQCTRRIPRLLAPALHPEPPAYMPAYRFMARSVDALLWNTASERELCHRIWGELPGEVVPPALNFKTSADARKSDLLNVTGSRHNDSEFKQSSYVAATMNTGTTQYESDSDETSASIPYILFCGRIDAGKGCAQLIDFFLEYRRENTQALHLILTGNLQLRLPTMDDIRYLGYVAEERKHALMRAALCVVVPSPYESLSYLALESLSIGTPVLVNAHSPVLMEHIATGGGLGYVDYESFARALRRILGDHEWRANASLNGCSYVQHQYAPERMRSQMNRVLERIGAPLLS
ncbi:MAG: glycosyltransferase family 4 protein [Leptospiraceae bacterium]|nr:glycosyltransferase family 4 protein [Leptospiraceae bacterium]